MSAETEIDRVHALVDPIASDLDLDVYDVERRGSTIRVTLDTLAGSESGITLDTLSLATRLVSREMDHEDPIAGHYTLEVTSPGLERPLRTPAHFQREVGKVITVRLRDSKADPRRIGGLLVAADGETVTIQVADGDGAERDLRITEIDKARTVFEWGPKPKPGKQPKSNGVKKAKKAKKSSGTTAAEQNTTTSTKEKQTS
jgi:ribosome maturation factor RimP